MKSRHRRVIRERPTDGEGAEFVELRPGELSGVFSAPAWLRDLGVMAWLVVGVGVLLVGGIWLLALTNTIVAPVVTAAIIAAVLSPVVANCSAVGSRARPAPRSSSSPSSRSACWSRVLILGGIASQAAELESALKSAAEKAKSAAQDAGVSTAQAQQANASASSGLSGAFHALLKGVGAGRRRRSARSRSSSRSWL